MSEEPRPDDDLPIDDIDPDEDGDDTVNKPEDVYERIYQEVRQRALRDQRRNGRSVFAL